MTTCVFVIRSENKIRGNNNNYEIVVPFSRRLPHGYTKFQLRSSFLLTAGDYRDFIAGGTDYYKQMCEVRVNLTNGRNYDTEAPFKSQLTLGFGQRVSLPENVGSTNNLEGKSYIEYKLTDSIVHIVDYPTSDSLTVQVWNVDVQFSNSDLLVASEEVGGTLQDDNDCTPHVLVLEFTGLE